MTIAVIAEKPSVARSIADVLGANQKGAGLRRGNGYAVSWAIGHLVGLAEPHEMDPAWKAWRYDRLPMLPKSWELRVLEQTREHYAILEALLLSSEIDRVVCATDAGREGELIFRYFYGNPDPGNLSDRLWISSLTPDAIKAGFAKLRPGTDFDNLAAAAEARSRADWLVGMNFSRAYTLRFGPDLLSVGRVQTPTLAMLVDREKAIRDFVPAKYCEVEAGFGESRGRLHRHLVRPWKVQVRGRRAGATLARKRRSRPGHPRSLRGEARTGGSELGHRQELPAAVLYDLTELQRHANRLYGITAQQTLTAAQTLYEQHKLLTIRGPTAATLARDSGGDARAMSSQAIASPYRRALGARNWRSAPRPALRRRCQGHRPPRDHSDHAAPREGKASPRRGADLRSRLPPPADGLARRPHLTRVTTVVTWRPQPGRSGRARDTFTLGGTVVTQPVGRSWIAVAQVQLEADRRGWGRRPTPAPGPRRRATAPCQRVEVKQRRLRPPNASPTRRCSPPWSPPAAPRQPRAGGSHARARSRDARDASGDPRDAADAPVRPAPGQVAPGHGKGHRV